MLTIAVLVAVPVLALLAFAATRPDIFHVRRSTSIKAQPEKIFPLINDLHAFNTWNPFEKKDPNVKGTYSGPSSGKGARYGWDGNKDIGKGTIQIVESAPSSKVTMQLNFIKPFEAHNLVEFTLEPGGDSTHVTWAMQGPLPFMAKIIHLFINMDRMVGKDFEAGLAYLKTIAEK
jgi:hypothetical protein